MELIYEEKIILFEEVQHIIEALQGDLKKLSICKCFIDPDFMCMIVNALRTNSTLTDINLSGCYIGENGMRILSEALVHNSTLINLDLSFNNIKDEGTVYLTKSLETNTTLKVLDLSVNWIDDEGARAIAKLLRCKNSALICIYLRYNEVSIESARLIDKVLETNRTLQFYDVGFIPSGFKKNIDALRLNQIIAKQYPEWLNRQRELIKKMKMYLRIPDVLYYEILFYANGNELIDGPPWRTPTGRQFAIEYLYKKTTGQILEQIL